jgi:two-component system, OmpR family, sensor kinase
VSRVPIRLRLTLAFAVVMAIMLGAVGLFLYSQQRIQLNKSIDQTLRTERSEVAALLRTGGGVLGPAGRRAVAVPTEESAQVLTVQGRLVDGTTGLRRRPLLDRSELARARRERIFAERNRVPGIEGAARLLAEPVTVQGKRLVVVAAKGVDDRDEDLASLADLLAILGPLALLLASLACYAVAAFALRPVENMRRRAGRISASEPGERLPVSPASDELRRLGLTLNEMLGRLEAALEHERAFVDDASHELRTPLAMHRTELELALRYGESAEELREAIASAIEEADRISQLAEDLLVMARSDKGQLALELKEIGVEPLLGEVSRRLSPSARERGRELAVEDCPGLVICADQGRIEQALENLVDNALHHGNGTVRLSAVAANGAVELHVSDGGRGFPPEFLPHAFERFRRADGSRGEGGAGLGLAIVEAIAVAHGGRARAANPAGGGADVWIEVPLRP